MSEILPEQDCSFSDFTQKCVSYVNFKIATKQHKLSAMFTIFTSLFNVYLIITKKKTQKESQINLFVTKESALLAMETKFHLGDDSGQEFT